MSAQTWDVSLSRGGGTRGDILSIYIPTVISRALIERGMWRASLEITSDGILLRPYVADAKQKSPSAVDLPDWGSS